MPKRLARPLILLTLVALAVVFLVRQGQRQQGSAIPAAPSAAQRASARPPRVATDRKLPLRLPDGEVARDAARPAGALSGRVVSARGGAPIAGASLSFEHGGVALSVTSDAGGAFLLEPREPGLYTLVLVTAKGFHPFAPEWGYSPLTLVAREGEIVRGLTVTLTPEVTYQGLVRGPSGDPVGGAEVRVIDAPSGAGAGQRFVADAKGAFTFSAPEDALLEATHPDHAPGRARVDARVQASGKLTLRLRARGSAGEEGQSIAGTVIDASGQPEIGAAVSASFRSDLPAAEGDLHPGGHAITDDRGAFRLDGLDAGRYTVTATTEDGAIARAEGVAAGTQDLALRLAAGGSIRGAVRDRASGAPASAFSVVAALQRGPVEREIIATSSFFDASGSYEIAGLLPGTYAVTAAALGHAPSATVVVTVPAGGEATADLALGRGGRLVGAVLEEGTQKPLEGARVSVEGSLGSGAGAVPLLSDATTDAAGRFTLEGLAEGPRSVAVTAADHHGRILSGLSVPEGGELGPVTIALSPVEPGEEPRMELVGIGAVLSARDDALLIGQVMAGGGAAQAGLGPGDAVVSIDGKNVVDLGFEEAVNRIRGPEGSVVTLAVRKGNKGSAVDVPVRRTRVRA